MARTWRIHKAASECSERLFDTPPAFLSGIDTLDKAGQVQSGSAEAPRGKRPRLVLPSSTTTTPSAAGRPLHDDKNDSAAAGIEDSGSCYPVSVNKSPRARHVYPPTGLGSPASTVLSTTSGSPPGDNISSGREATKESGSSLPVSVNKSPTTTNVRQPGGEAGRAEGKGLRDEPHGGDADVYDSWGRLPGDKSVSIFECPVMAPEIMKAMVDEAIKDLKTPPPDDDYHVCQEEMDEIIRRNGGTPAPKGGPSSTKPGLQRDNGRITNLGEHKRRVDVCHFCFLTNLFVCHCGTIHLRILCMYRIYGAPPATLSNLLSL